MYADSVILEKLARFKMKYGWQPIYHSVDQVIQANATIDALQIKKADGIYFDTDAWTPKLKRWVLNERALCAFDASYFLTRYFFLSANNDIFRFEFRSGQKAFYKVIQDLEAKGQSIEIQCLKARKQGISTLVEGLMTHAALFVLGSKCSIASADEQKTAVMMDMMYEALGHLPWWLPPTRTKDKRSGKAILQFSHVNSSIIVQSGSMKGGIGQGTTPTRIHLSEVVDYTNPVVQIEEGLFKAVPSSPEIFMVLESTGNGNTGWWADQWRTNKAGYWEGRARLLPLFLPWFMTPELFPTDHWMQKFPFPESYHPSPEALAMKAKSDLYVRSTPILRSILGDGWELPMEQVWYWQYNYDDAKMRHTEKSWTRQMPVDDLEALVGENDQIFDKTMVAEIHTRRAKNPWVYGIIGNDIPEKHEPSPMEVTNEVRIPVSFTTKKGERLEWLLMPMKGDTESKDFNPLKKLIIYQHPEKGADYSIGGDTGTGVGRDRSVISVTMKGQRDEPDIQVAEFCSDDLPEAEIITYIACVAAYYGARKLDGGQVKIAIEQKRKYGDLPQSQLKLMGFKRMHQWHQFDKKTLKPSDSPSGREGIFTNAWSRPMITGLFRYAIENGWYEPNSKWLLEEIENLEMKTMTSGKTRMDHAAGKHDDRYFAAANSYFTTHSLDVLGDRASRRYNREPEKELEIDYTPYYPSIKGSGEEFWNGTGR